MNRGILILFISCALPFLSSGQDREKIKGSRDVTIEQTYVDGFNKIIVGEEFSVEIIYNSKSSVEVEADNNLHEYINFEVVDSTLTFKTTADITSKRKMAIKVNYSQKLKYIETREDGEIRSLTSLELANAELKTSGSSKAYLNIKANDLKLVALDRSRLRLNLTTQNADIELSDNVKLEALLNTKGLKMGLFQRASADIEGTATETILRTDNNSQFDGKNFTSSTCQITAEVDSEVYIEVTESLDLEASGSSQVYIYNNPQINLNRFTDTAKLQKKTL